ncbi:MAG: AI-2E family transporter [Terriglobales bacterium]
MAEPVNVRALERRSEKAEETQEAGQEPVPASPPPQLPTPPPGGDVERGLRRLQAGSLAVIATAVVLTLCYFAKLFLIVILVSILLAFVLAPIVDMLRRLRLPRPVGAAIAVLLFLAALYGLFYFSYSRAVEFAQELPRYEGEIRKVASHLRQKAESIQKTTKRVLPEPEKQSAQVKVEQSRSWATFLAGLGSVTEMVLAVSFIPFLVYFMLSWQEHVRAASVMLFKMENRNTAYVTLGQISSMIRGFIVGNVLVGIIIGTISMGVFAILHLPYFYFLGYISGFLSLVPYLGVILAVVPPVLAGIGHIHSTQFLAIVITVFSLHLFALNVLYPKFLGSRLQLNPLAVTLALFFWGWLWGAMGLILAIPITAAAKIVFDHVESLRPYAAWLGE